MGKKPLKTFAGVFLLLTVSALGIWMMRLDASFIGNVTSTSESPLSWQVDFSNVALDTTHGVVSNTTHSEIANIDGVIDAVLSIDIDKTDVEDDCTDYQNDCTVVFEFDGMEAQDGDTLTISSGMHDLDATLECARLSCPQQIQVNISIDTS